MTGLTADLIGSASIHSKYSPKSNLVRPHHLDTHAVFKQALNLSVHSHILPYQTIDSNLIFHNTDSYGCGIRLSLNTDNHAKLTPLLLDVLKAFPANIDCTIILHQPDPLHTILRHHQELISTQTSSPLDALQCYLFLSARESKHTLLICRKQLEFKLDIAKQKYARLGKMDLLILIRTWLAHPDKWQPSPTFVDINHRAFHALIPPARTVLTPQSEYLQIDYLDPLNHPCTHNVINCHLDALTTRQLENELPLFRPDLQLPCPFWISFTLRSHPIKNTVTYFHNIVLITQREKALTDLQQSQTLYQAYGYQLKPAKSHQSICFLSGLPFFITDGYDQYLYHQNLLHTLPTSQLSKIIPLLFCQRDQKDISSFDENQIPGYDDILIHMNTTQRFHRFKKRNKTCRTR